MYNKSLKNNIGKIQYSVFMKLISKHFPPIHKFIKVFNNNNNNNNNDNNNNNNDKNMHRQIRAFSQHTGHFCNIA